MTHPRFHAAVRPDKPAAVMSDTGEVLTYGALELVGNQGAHLFRSLGIQNGDSVAIWLPNSLHYYEFYWAGQRSGVYIAPISTALTADEAAYILSDCSAKFLLTCHQIAGLPKFLNIYRDRCAALASILFTDDAGDGIGSWQSALAKQATIPIADEQAGFHMVYSSGTTGRPKGVRLPLTGGAATDEHDLAVRQQTTYGVDENTIYLSPAPLYHTAPLAFTTTAQRIGSTVVLMRKFDPEATLAAIAVYRVDFVQMVPTMFIRLLRLPDKVREAYDLSSLRVVLHAAAPCPVAVKRQMIDWLGPIVFEYYAGSEGAGATFITTQEWLRKPGSVGRASWGKIHICDAEGQELPAGSQGVVYFEGGWDFTYLNDPQKTLDSRHPSYRHWSTLGDVGYLDADGYLFLTDRLSFMIISGGVNIYPQETENILAEHPKIADVAVVGVPSAEMGEEVRAVVQPIDWGDANPVFAEELIAYCRSRLSHIKCPRAIDFDPALPRHDTGKLYKRLIRERYWIRPAL